MTSREEQEWIDRQIEFPNPEITHHRLREQSPFILVEDTFRNVFYRFEINETEIAARFLAEWKPASWSVHLVGAIQDLTFLFKQNQQR